MSVNGVTGKSYQVGFISNKIQEVPKENKASIFSGNLDSSLGSSIKNIASSIKTDYSEALSQGDSMSQGAKALEAAKDGKTSTIFSLSGSRDGISNNISNLAYQKFNASMRKANLSADQTIRRITSNAIESKISSFRNQIAALQASINTGKGTVAATGSASVAIDTGATVNNQGSSAGAAIAETQGSSTTETKIASEVTAAETNVAKNNDAIQKQINELNNKIEKLLAELGSANKQQTESFFSSESEVNSDVKINFQINTEEISLIHVESGITDNEDESKTINDSLQGQSAAIGQNDSRVSQLARVLSMVDSTSTANPEGLADRLASILSSAAVNNRAYSDLQLINSLVDSSQQNKTLVKA